MFRELQKAHHTCTGKCKLSVDTDMSAEVAGSQIMRDLCFLLRNKDSSQGNMEPLEGFKTTTQYNRIYNIDQYSGNRVGDGLKWRDTVCVLVDI